MHPLLSIHHFFAVLLGLCLLPLPAIAEPTWREVQSPHFRIITDGSEKDGRKVAYQFEQMRQVFVVLFHKEEFESGAPLTIVAARNLETYKSLEPELWKLQGDRVAGEFHRGWEKQFALVRLDTFEGRNQPVVYHEYTHSILHANFLWLPTWLDEGLAEFYGYTAFDGRKVYVGTPSLRMKSHLMSVYFSTDFMLKLQNTFALKNEKEADFFYLQAWAMVHYMMFGEQMGGGGKLMTFITKLEHQESQERAFEEVFGPLKKFEIELEKHTRQLALPNGVLPMDKIADASTFTASTLTSAQKDYELGSYAIGNHDRKQGKLLMDEAIKLDPTLAKAHEELGYLAFEQGHVEEARVQWTQALVLNNRLPRANYALAMTTKSLSQQSPAELNKTQLALEQVTKLAPRFAPAYVELALAEWRLSQIRQAYLDAAKAEKLEPSRAGYRLLIARLLLRGHQPEAAAQEANYVATHWFGPDHNEAVELLQQIPSQFRTHTSESAFVTPAETTTVHGTLLSSTCTADGKDKLTIQVQPDDAKKPVLSLASNGEFVQGWSDTLWWGSDHVTSCLNVSGSPVLVAYKPDGNGGILKDIEVRDTFPRTDAPASAGTGTSTPVAQPATP